VITEATSAVHLQGLPDTHRVPCPGRTDPSCSLSYQAPPGCAATA